jgi:ATP-dependent 26S proteasome regulatory subunit
METGSYVGEVVKVMDKKKILVKVHPEGKFVVDIDKNIDVADITPNCRVALRNDSYTLHKILPNKVDPLVIFAPGATSFSQIAILSTHKQFFSLGAEAK